MDMNDFMRAILEVAPEALFDEEYRSGEIMVSPGFILMDGEVVPIPNLAS
jgi:hypothetical protein